MKCDYCGDEHGQYCPERAHRYQKGLEVGKAQLPSLRSVRDAVFGRKHKLD